LVGKFYRHAFSHFNISYSKLFKMLEKYNRNDLSSLPGYAVEDRGLKCALLAVTSHKQRVLCGLHTAILHRLQVIKL